MPDAEALFGLMRVMGENRDHTHVEAELWAAGNE